MRVFNDYKNIPEEAKHSVLAIGNFDNVHKGHQEILKRGKLIAQRMNAPFAVMIFEPHPRSFFHPEEPSFRLSSLRAKIRYLDLCGVDFLFIVHFNHEFAQKTPQEFISDILVKELQIRHIISGYNFRFGKNRAGNNALLRSYSTIAGFESTDVGAITDEFGLIYSTAQIRAYIMSGKPYNAGQMSGRPWEIEGRVLNHDKLNRTIGYATAEIEINDYINPAYGVYAVRACVIPSSIHDTDLLELNDGIGFFRLRQTPSGNAKLFGIHLFDFNEDIYGANLNIQVIDFIRHQKKFNDVDAIKEQIQEDILQVKKVLSMPFQY